MPKLTQQQFYCLKCRRKILCKKDDIGVVDLKNKKSKTGKVPALKAECSRGKCDCTVMKFIKHKDRSKMLDKFGKW